jgi:hypothetical protein
MEVYHPITVISKAKTCSLTFYISRTRQKDRCPLCHPSPSIIATPSTYFMLHQTSHLPGYLITHNNSQPLLASRLNRQQNHGNKSRQDQRTRHKDRCVRVCARNIGSNNRRTKSRNSVNEAADSSSSASYRSREDFGGISVEDTIHDILEECLNGGEG